MFSAGRSRHLALGLLIATLALGSRAASLPVLHPRASAVEGWVFFSSNTVQGLSFKQSLGRLSSPEQGQGRRLVSWLLADLGLVAPTVHDAIGDWDGGVENSLLVRVPASDDMATLRCAGAWLGLTCRQQAVLVFRADAEGQDRLTTIETSGPIEVIRRQLDRHGVRDRTIVCRGVGCKVIVVDRGGLHQARLQKAARVLGGEMRTQSGCCEMLAGPTPDAASRRYRDAMLMWRVSARRW